MGGRPGHNAASSDKSGPEDELRRIFETNFFGSLRVANAFAPILAANGGGTLLNILSSAAWISLPTAYAASKAAFWSATNALRFELEGQGTQVVGLLVGMIETPITANYDVPKSSPASVVSQAYEGVATGALEVLADRSDARSEIQAEHKSGGVLPLDARPTARILCVLIGQARLAVFASFAVARAKLNVRFLWLRYCCDCGGLRSRARGRMAREFEESSAQSRRLCHRYHMTRMSTAISIVVAYVAIPLALVWANSASQLRSQM